MQRRSQGSRFSWLTFGAFCSLGVLGACTLRQGGTAKDTTDAAPPVAPADAGELDASDATADSSDGALPPAPLVFTATSVGPLRACGVTSTGNVKCWGSGAFGAIGDGETISRAMPTDVGGLADVKQVAVGRDHTCALTNGGGVKCWGHNAAGQIGDASNTQRNAPTDVSGLATGVTAVVTGDAHSCALTTNGGVKCWGNNVVGQLGDGTTTNRNVPTDVTTLASGVIAIAAGARHTCALSSSGAVRCWGANESGQVGDNTVVHALAPAEVKTLTSGIAAIGAGASHSCAIVAATGAIQCWGQNLQGQLGDGSKTDRKTAVDVADLTGKAVAVTGGFAHTCAQMEGGGAQCWGANSLGELGDGTVAQRSMPGAASLGLLSGEAVAALDAGGATSCALLTTGKVRCWGSNRSGQLGDGKAFVLTAIDLAGAGTDVLGLSGSPARFCALRSGSVVTCWGAGATFDTVLGLGGGVLSVALGTTHTCAVVGGALSCWGQNTNGQLGDNTTAAKALPTPVPLLPSGVATVTAGDAYTCVRTSSGGAKCWGKNDLGQLGDNSTTERRQPVDVSGLTTGVLALAASTGGTTCAVVMGNATKCWGDGFGQVPVIGNPGATAVSIGLSHGCAIVAAGAVKCWGANGSGQLGNASNVASATPVDVSGITGAIAISAGARHTCAILAGGVIRCWGENELGALGDATTTARNTPVIVQGITGATAVAAGAASTCALVNGGVKCWGSADRCELGTCAGRGPVDVAGP